jgi:hypothetical protein
MIIALLSFEVFMKLGVCVCVCVLMALCVLRVCGSFNANQHTTLF